MPDAPPAPAPDSGAAPDSAPAPDVAPASDVGPDSGIDPSPTWVPVPHIAATLGLIVTKVHQLIKDRQLVAVRVDGVLKVPAEFVDGPVVVKGLPGTIIQLTDVGYSDAEIVEWLFRTDDTLPGNPITALRENRGKEVHRRAHTAGY